jgi:tripeptidyl-peptidase II
MKSFRLFVVLCPAVLAVSDAFINGFINGHPHQVVSSSSRFAFVPTSETKAYDLLSQNPTYDGRGTIVAVLDTGCDLKAAGLIKTSTGENKYVDFIDATGGGDIDMSSKINVTLLVTKADTKSDTKSDTKVITSPITKRNLTLPEKVGGGDVHDVRVGATRLYAHLPGSSKERIMEQRKKAFLLKQVRGKRQTTTN